MYASLESQSLDPVGFDESSLNRDNGGVISLPMWACGAAGSALPWHGRGHRFDPDQVHQTPLSLLIEVGARPVNARVPACREGHRFDPDQVHQTPLSLLIEVGARPVNARVPACREGHRFDPDQVHQTPLSLLIEVGARPVNARVPACREGHRFDPDQVHQSVLSVLEYYIYDKQSSHFPQKLATSAREGHGRGFSAF